MAHGLRVGTYSSPHINRINDRICINGEPIDDTEFGLQIGAIADLEILSAIRPSFFEIMTAAMFRWFADEAVDVAPRIKRDLFVPYKSSLQPEGLHPARGMAGSDLRPLSKIPHCCLP